MESATVCEKAVRLQMRLQCWWYTPLGEDLEVKACSLDLVMEDQAAVQEELVAANDLVKAHKLRESLPGAAKHGLVLRWCRRERLLQRYAGDLR